MSNTAPEIKRIISQFCLYGVWLYMQLGSGKMTVSHFFVSLILWLFNVCRAVDEIDKQILQHTSLKVLYFYRQHVTAVSKDWAVLWWHLPFFLLHWFLKALARDDWEYSILTDWVFLCTGVPSYNVWTWRTPSALLRLAQLGLQFPWECPPQCARWGSDYSLSCCVSFLFLLELTEQVTFKVWLSGFFSAIW